MNTHDYLAKLTEAGWTQSRIAAESGVSQPAINRILNNKQADVRHASGKRLEALYLSVFAVSKKQQRKAA